MLLVRQMLEVNGIRSGEPVGVVNMYLFKFAGAPFVRKMNLISFYLCRKKIFNNKFQILDFEHRRLLLIGMKVNSLQ